MLEALGASDSIQEIHHDLVVHTPGREVRWPVPEPFCTFDYGACCRAAFDASGAGFVRAAVRGRRGTRALTSAGEIPARVLVDATGWRAALAGRAAAAHDGRYFGLEAEVPAPFVPGLHFYFWRDVAPDGYAWVFPAGSRSRVGVLSYRGRSSVGAQLDALLARLRLPGGPRHGGFLGARLAPPVVDGVFVAGDAAGHCLPFTGEGIRSAVWAGRVCGAVVRRFLDGEITAAAAAAGYEAYVARQRRRFRVLEWSTVAALRLPARVLGVLAAWVSRPGPLGAFMRHYLAMFSEEIEQTA